MNDATQYIAAVLHRFGWWDILDILIVSIGLYEILKLIKGTRAVQMGLGAGFLLVLFYLSRLGHLEMVNWLVRNMVGYVVFALIVLFQADIRRALAHFGRTPFMAFLARPEGADEMIEELAVAAGMLASQRIGAIIAIEREIGLRNYIEGGIPLDSTITYDLIVTIFRPGTPLHDGAVIVQGDRIAAAACFLPLTVNPRVSKDFGTRHRAAIGLTEETDAVAIIVSEETSRISLALEGRIDSGLSVEDLRARLRSLLSTRATARRDPRAGVYD